MGWIEFYSQGEFTGDEDTQGYVMRVSLYGIVSLALPVLLLIAARVVGCTGKISLQSRWALGFFLLPAIGMLAWATVVTATASPVENVNLAVEPLQVLTPTLRPQRQPKSDAHFRIGDPMRSLLLAMSEMPFNQYVTARVLVRVMAKPRRQGQQKPRWKIFSSCMTTPQSLTMS